MGINESKKGNIHPGGRMWKGRRRNEGEAFLLLLFHPRLVVISLGFCFHWFMRPLSTSPLSVSLRTLNCCHSSSSARRVPQSRAPGILLYQRGSSEYSVSFWVGYVRGQIVTFFTFLGIAASLKLA